MESGCKRSSWPPYAMDTNTSRSVKSTPSTMMHSVGVVHSIMRPPPYACTTITCMVCVTGAE